MLYPRSFYGGDLFDSMRRLQSEMNRLFEGSGFGEPAGFPAMNVYASQDGIAVTAEVPGVPRDKLEITVHRDTLTLRGERQDARDAKGFHRRERGSGRFVRTLSLPYQVDPDHVEAQLHNGVLRLSLHRPEADRPKTIKVNAA